jgi:tungstate transport system substrate-binding protein
VLLVRAPSDADAFVADGFALAVRPVFQADFVLVGPRDDPAGCAGLSDVREALRRIARRFVSRGDDSWAAERTRAL